MKGQKLGFIGLGTMGAAMTRNLINGGFELFVHNRTASRAEHLIKCGANWCETPSELAAQVDTILMCLTDGEAVESIIFGETGVMHGGGELRRLIDLSTISPSEAVAFHSALSSVGVTYIDAPVTGGDIGAREGTLTVMVGAEQEEFEVVKPLLSWLGRRIVRTGGVGSGQLTKCVNQLIVANTLAAMTEGLVFAEAVGLNLDRVVEIVSSGAAGSWALSNYAPRILAGDFNPGFYAKDMLKDLRIVANEAQVAEVSLPVHGLVKQLYEAMCAAGDDELGNHALIKVYERLSGKR